MVGPQWAFLDRDLEKLRQRLQTAISAFSVDISVTAGVSASDPDIYDLMLRSVRDSSPEMRAQFEASSERINGRAQDLVDSYDALVTKARQRLHVALLSDDRGREAFVTDPDHR
jgi:hypothetical protein